MQKSLLAMKSSKYGGLGRDAGNGDPVTTEIDDAYSEHTMLDRPLQRERPIDLLISFEGPIRSDDRRAEAKRIRSFETGAPVAFTSSPSIAVHRCQLTNVG